MNAEQEIRTELAREARSRRWRTLAAGGLSVAGAAAFPLLLSAKPIGAPDALATAAGSLAAALGLAFAASSRRLPARSALVFATLALLTPLLATRVLVGGDGGDLGRVAAGCLGLALGGGILVGMAASAALGPSRRRFGGAPVLTATAFALLPTLGLGLHCAHASLAHLAHHSLGAAAVAVLFASALAFAPADLRRAPTRK